MSHHLSGPDLKSPSDDARLDLADVFVFLSPDGKNTVLVMNANPDFGGQAPAYHPEAVYRVNVDTDGDSDADIAFSYVALLHKSDEGWASPFPGRTYPATSVTGMPSAVKPFRTATRTWNSAT